MKKAGAVNAVGLLADPIRRSLYDYVVNRHEAVTREEAAEATGVTLSKAKFHLDRLERAGLLEAEFRRPPGRSGPGAGRPAKWYRRAGGEVQVSLPERRYDVVGRILAEAVERSGGGPVAPSVASTAYERGRADAADAELTGTDAFDTAGAVLAQLGYEPERRGDEIVLHNCPFDALVEQHRDLVCTMNERYVRGVLDAVGVDSLESHLRPHEGMCCVIARTPSSEPAGCADGCACEA